MSVVSPTVVSYKILHSVPPFCRAQAHFKSFVFCAILLASRSLAMASSNSLAVAGFALTVLLIVGVPSTNGQLSTEYYSKSCPKVFETVKSTVHSAIAKETRMGASLLRLFFHDCFVNVSKSSRSLLANMFVILVWTMFSTILFYTMNRVLISLFDRDVMARFFWTTHRASRERRMLPQTETLPGDLTSSTTSSLPWRRCAPAWSPVLIYWPSRLATLS